NELLGTKDLVKFDLDFTGNVLVNESTHQRIGSSDIVTTDSYDYDHMQRPTKHAQSINGSAWELISENTYDELGQLKRKDVGNATGSALQNVDFAYNVRGWLKSINNIDNIGNDLFTFELSYNNPDLSGAIGLYNGNISETIWRTANDKNATTPVSNRGYRYKYDALNRIVTATNFLNMSSSYKYRLETSYDKNGNITRLKRGGKTNYYLIDDLSYTYNAGNKLEGVSDNYTSYIVDEGFIDGNNTGYDYGYDLDGNLTSDLNKGIAVGGIEYNHLNMPTKITVSNAGSNNGVIDYVYTADGIKLQKKKTQGGVTITTDYAGDFVYENNTMKQFYQPEGYVEPDGSGWQYVYQYRDIWGNTRITYADDDNSGSVTNSEIRKEQNYYPFGLEHKGYNIASYGAENNLKTYQGQEFTGDLGLNTHEWKYRMSDPAIGRFWQIDPLAEDYTYNSTYAFQENKMGMGVELEGLELKRFQDGLKELITGISRMISEPLNVNRQMDKNGFRQNERSEIARIESRQEMSQAVGQTAYGGSETLKGGTKTVGEGLKVSGDGITYIGIAIAQPGVVAAGETISSVGTGMNAMVDISDGKPVENVALETIVSMGFGKAGKMGVKATQKVAGKEFIKSGANKTTESIIQGTVKGYEKIFENYITPQILPEKNKIPVYGPMKD
ncbi:MAG: RHS repeat domain-containing protein, partial [Flavobacteriaceae bacterium]